MVQLFDKDDHSDCTQKITAAVCPAFLSLINFTLSRSSKMLNQMGGLFLFFPQKNLNEIFLFKSLQSMDAPAEEVWVCRNILLEPDTCLAQFASGEELACACRPYASKDRDKLASFSRSNASFFQNARSYICQ